VARNDIFIDSPVSVVFEVLSDPRAYGRWVVGSREIRKADDHWPVAGAAIAHTVGKPPLLIKDETEVVHARPPVRLALLAKARPLPSAQITLDLQPEGSGTRVTMVEDISSRALNTLGGPILHAAVRWRNREALRRLKALAEGSEPRPAGALPRRAKPST
jgi:uncharacterized protein YndB with AHSA1/START domain